MHIVVQSVSALLGGISLGAASISAFYWYKSAVVPLAPLGSADTGSAHINHASWTFGIMTAIAEASNWNRRAAVFTGISVVTGALANFPVSILAVYS